MDKVFFDFKKTFLLFLGLFLGMGAGKAVTDTDSIIFHSKREPFPKRTISVGEAVVKAVRRSVSGNAVSHRISATDIQRSLGKSLTDVLQTVAGVSSVQTGSNVAKPVIQGMQGTRILILNNGVRQTGQQWGIDHAPEIDQHSTQSIHVVKGAESVRYGAEALGGIILLEQNALPYRQKDITGSVATLYGTNGRRYALLGRVEGSLPFVNNVAWRLQTTLGNGGDRSTARYLLNNTGSGEMNLSAAIGWKDENRKAEFFYSRYDHRFGVMRSAQMGNEELLTERIKLGQPTQIYPFRRAIDFPYQHVVHHNATFKLHYFSETLGTWLWQTAFQQDDRTENRIRRLNRSDIPAVSLHLHSFQNQLNWRKDFGEWSTEAGGQWVSINNRNQAGTGVVPIIPNYTENSVGGYVMQKYAKGKWGAEAGLRYDHQTTKAAGYDWTGKLYGGTRHFDNLTYSVGAKYRCSPSLAVTSNLGMAWRAPHVYELYSNGNELGSGVFVRGDEHLSSEHGYKWITSVEFRHPNIKLCADGFLQWIDNYIYDEPTHKNITVVSGAYPVFQYKQTSAFFRGVDVDASWTPLRSVGYRTQLSLIWAHEHKTGNYLPYIPAPRITQEATWSSKLGRDGKVWVGIKHLFVARQTRFNPATDLIATTPPAYGLWGGEIGWEYSPGAKQKLRLLVAADNLFNLQYKEYTNRARYYSHDLGRDIRCSLSWMF